MAERKERELPPAASLKLTELEAPCIHTEMAKKQGMSRNRLQKHLDSQVDKAAQQSLKEAEFSRLKAQVLEQSLEEMIKEHADRFLWLDIIDHKLKAGAKKNESSNMLKWFEYLQFKASKKLLDTDKALAQLQLKIDLLKMHAADIKGF